MGNNFGNSFSDRLVEIITSYRDNGWDIFYAFLDELPNGEIIPCLSEVVSRLGGQKLRYEGNSCLEVMESRFGIPGMYEFFFENFEPSEENKAVTAEYIIMSETPDIFDIAEQYGWFDDLEFINKMIEFSSGIKNIEFTAWLLDCKNRHFDIAAEREEAEKKLTLN